MTTEFVWTIHKCAEPTCEQIAVTPHQHWYCVERGHRLGTVPVKVAPLSVARRARPDQPAAGTDDDVKRVTRGNQRGRCLLVTAAFISEGGEPPTAEQVSVRSAIPLNSVSTRMSELVEGGWLEVVDERGRTSTGSAASRYGLTDKGRSWLVHAP